MSDTIPEPKAPALLAIVEVDKAQRVYCAQPGCRHTVYKAIHVVREQGELLVLGSTCFAKRFGGLSALGAARYGGGQGPVLTPEERALLVDNTQALLAQFEAQAAQAAEAERKLAEEEAQRRQVLAQAQAVRMKQLWEPRDRIPRVHWRSDRPWPWVKPYSSYLAIQLQDGSGWVRAQHRDGRQFIVPWPAFDGWEEALPPTVGQPDPEIGGYAVGQILAAVAYLRERSVRERITGNWQEVIALLSPRAGGFHGP